MKHICVNTLYNQAQSWMTTAHAYDTMAFPLYKECVSERIMFKKLTCTSYNRYSTVLAEFAIWLKFHCIIKRQSEKNGS